ncbi:flagellar biosynthesis anti-sigma factor FlgM [Billgrantia endophytica]|uniref:Negative regulator of flagellin synthesis n=1 Tax=Billgrantia endophytica TaxID=2033802 RepID=A0A2N7U9D6_9GAMM|nr:flagellar biosynthesis anti-sigma factor FlgM [Halomonas endophytica]PMR77034.1 flagellar biosynthesis anti-sigma factor FlgM [Halomonas endophytica]
MKINSQNPLTRPTPTSPREESQQVKGASQPNQQDAGPAATTHLRQADGSRDIDVARVDEIREAIREGRLEIRAERIADALIESLQQTAGKGDE